MTDFILGFWGMIHGKLPMSFQMFSQKAALPNLIEMLVEKGLAYTPVFTVNVVVVCAMYLLDIYCGKGG